MAFGPQKTATVGQPKACARCLGPLSFPRKAAA
jgi:hypothetical protein